MRLIHWADYPNFSKTEFDCKHTGKNEMLPEFMDLLQMIRSDYNKPMPISSGYRDKTHPEERKKKATGAHSLGCACDVAVSGVDSIRLIAVAYYYGINRIGVAKTFIHLDIADRLFGFPKALWTYKSK